MALTFDQISESVVAAAEADARSSKGSNLSSPMYKYDFVVATTQASINATMMAFLSTLHEPVAVVCYHADEQGNPALIGYEELKASANGSDPFNIPNDADPNTNQDIRNLVGARFMFGFRAQLGLPRMADPKTLPDLVNLSEGASSVIFNMLCSQFDIVELDPGSVYQPKFRWLNYSQPDSTPWVFTSKVDLRLITVAGTAYSTLPADIQAKIQAKIKELGSAAFSVQQLLFDLTNASLMSVPQISGVVGGTPLHTALQAAFVDAYFTQMQSSGQPLLNCSIVVQSAPISTLALTSFEFQVNQYCDANGQPILQPTPEQQQLATLNYLCAADGNALQPACIFTWNWVDATQMNDHDGVIAINRNTLANYFHAQLAPSVPQNCLAITAKCWQSAGIPNYGCSIATMQAPTSVTFPATGSTVLCFDYSHSSDQQCGLNDDLGSLAFISTFKLTVDFIDNTIVVKQQLNVNMYVRVYTTSGSGDIVNKTLTDTYSLGIDSSGALACTSFKSDPQDHSYSPSVNPALNFFTNLNSISNSITQWINGFVPSNLKDMPISTIQDYVFPGGQTFVFKDVSFSMYQDLVAFISYADPTGPMPTVPTTAQKPFQMVKN